MVGKSRQGMDVFEGHFGNLGGQKKILEIFLSFFDGNFENLAEVMKMRGLEIFIKIN